MRAKMLKLYISHFLSGLVFWYGIEKLFMTHIGIDAVGVGLITALYLAFNLFFDIPSGILADKWSRKGMLIVSMACLALASFVMGSSNSLLVYALGYLLYGAYVVGTSGTYQALTYDILHEKKNTKAYSRVSGQSLALFLVGAGMANITSGFIASHFSYQTDFFITAIPCLLNVLVLMSITEPSFHRAEKKEKTIQQLGEVAKTVGSIALLRTLATVMTALAIVEVFKGEFGQLYMLRYVSQPQYIGLLWAAYAFTWALGSFLAHKFTARLHSLVILATAPFMAMAFIDHWFGLVLFMVQAIASAALRNQIETRIQENTPSAVRASVLSILSALGRAVAIPASLVLGWICAQYNTLWAVRAVAIVAAVTLGFWVLASRRAPKHKQPAAQLVSS